MTKQALFDNYKNPLYFLLKGLFEVIPQQYLSIFTEEELSILLEGEQSTFINSPNNIQCRNRYYWLERAYCLHERIFRSPPCCWILLENCSIVGLQTAVITSFLCNRLYISSGSNNQQWLILRYWGFLTWKDRMGEIYPSVCHLFLSQ